MSTLSWQALATTARPRFASFAHCAGSIFDWEERMQWGMPGYGPAGADSAVSFNNQKNYISFYPGKAALEEHRGKLEGANFGGGCIRFTKPDRIDFEAVSKMLRHVRANRS